MILLDDVVEAFDLVDLDAPFVFSILAFSRRSVGTALVDRDLLTRPITPDRLAQESQRGFAIWLGGQQEILCGAGLVDPADPDTSRYP
jgi:hypothetical protein